ncbi:MULTISPECIES: AI-2E family transporter [Halorussus]|uniref:AI-2E family transporter n=1 Tax=Halorussus TaxID=1070314 RepID=UPI00209ECC35|nr:AI-2E family transporter [Halorussus vallis]USZ75903.1 AI-2E family transporter [Halorussus vallis]
MNVRDAFFALLLGALAVLAALVVRPFLSYVLAAGLLAFVLHPAHRRIAPRIGERPAALGLTTLAVAAMTVPFALLTMSVLPDAAETAEEVTRRPILDRVERLFRSVGVQVELGDVNSLSRQFADLFVGNISELLGATVKVVLGLSLLVFVLYYLLVDGERFVRWVRDLTPLPPEVQDRLYDETYEVTWAVLKGHVFVGVAQGLLCGVGFFAVGLPDALFWTVATVLFAFVPVVGVAAVWVPAGVYLLAVGNVVGGAALIVYGATVVSWVDNYLRAYLVDLGAGLHPAVVLVGVVGGVYFVGALGLFVGPIVLAVFKATATVVDDYYGL